MPPTRICADLNGITRTKRPPLPTLTFKPKIGSEHSTDMAKRSSRLLKMARAA